MIEQPGPTAPSKILIVDDRPENLLALEAILSGLGHELLRATSGEEALKQLLVEEVALILLDVQMPGMDGFETAAHVKARERTSHIPIVFLTAIDGEAHQAYRGYTAGGVDYLAKPFDPWVLRAKVGVFIELHERRQALAAQAATLNRQLAAHLDGDAPRLVSAALASMRSAEVAAAAAGDVAVITAVHEAVVALEAARDTFPTTTVWS
jgi:CheY-like chemotaxis protein